MFCKCSCQTEVACAIRSCPRDCRGIWAMYGQIATVAFVGVEARPVEVQVPITPPPPPPPPPPRRPLAPPPPPADLPKEGSHFDLPIVLALLVAMGAISPEA